MVRLPSAIAMIVALVATAGATELPQRMGMFVQASTPLPMLDSKIAVSAHGPMVEATVAQTFRNDSDHAIEATYVFPLPADAAVSAMTIAYGARTIHASIAKRDDAQRRYEDAVAAGLGAALLDQERADVFTQTVSAIPPHATVVVTLRYDTVARYEGGTWQLALPLVVAPRYVPGTASGRSTTGTGRAPDTDRAPDASRVTPNASPGAGGKTEIAFELADAAVDVTSPTHELKKHGTGYAIIDEHSDHDAIVRWREKVPDEGWVEQDDDGGYAAILVEAPPAAAKPHEVRALLLVDRAATTRGDADLVEHPLARALLGALGTSDHVSLGTEWQAPEQALRALEQSWGKQVGAFDLTKALSGARGRGAAAIVLVTDGLVADDRAALAAAKQVGAPIHVIGVGPAPNRSLLAAIATATGGTVRFAIAGDDLAVMAQGTVADLATPPAPLAVTWGTLAARDVVPAQMPRLGAGQAALVVARVDRAHTANARARGDVFAFASIDVKRAPEGATSPKGPLARRWARLKLDELIAANDRNSIAAHALRYGLVSPMTSMIAIGDEVVVSGGVKHTVPVPVSLPAGMRWQTVKRELAVDANAGGTVTLEAKSEPQPPADKKVPVAKLPERNGHEAPAQPKPAKKASEREERKHKDDDGDDDEDGRKVSRHRVQDAPRATTAAGPHAPPAPVAAHEAPPPVAAQGSTAPATGEDARAPMAPPEAESKTATIDGDAAGAAEATMVDEVMVSAPSSGSHRRLRFSLGLGAAAEHGASDLVVANRLSYEVGGRLRLGAEGALWFVDGAHAQGTLLATFARLSLIPHLDLIGGFGLHLGGGAGPAGALGLRWRLKPHLSAFLRYDGALLFHDSTRDGQNTGTLGVETSF